MQATVVDSRDVQSENRQPTNRVLLGWPVGTNRVRAHRAVEARESVCGFLVGADIKR